ncbi:MAG: hypothetical protein H6737_17290 [Alphaproteobacteria bacterium]|nr:hypothetical protein [Alphaproteobacteria bacterium]
MSDDNAFAPGSDFDRGAQLDYDATPAPLDLMPILERSWMVAKANMSVLLPAFAVLFIVQMAAVGVSISMGVWGAIDESMYWPTTGFNLIFGFFFGFVVTFLNLGYIRILLHLDRAEEADAGMLIGEGGKFAQAAIAFVIIYLGLQIGNLMCVLPGLAVAYLTSFTYIAMVDEDLDAFEALQRSMNVCIEQAGILIVLLLVYIAATFGAFCLTAGLGLPLLMAAVPLVQVVTWRAIKAIEA